MPFSRRIGGSNKKEGTDRNNSLGRNCLSPKQMEYIYIQEGRLGNLINKITGREEIDSDMELDRMDNNSGDENPYRELIVNNTGKIENKLSQMEQLSILSNVINYVQYSKNPKKFHAMLIRPINKKKVSAGRGEIHRNEFSLKIDLVSTLDKSIEEYLGRYEGIKSEILNTTGFNEKLDLSKTYLDRLNMTRSDKMAVEEKFFNNRARVCSR